MTENIHDKIQEVFDKVIYTAPPQLPQRVRGQVYDSLGMNVTEQLNTSLRGLVSEQSQSIETLTKENERLKTTYVVKQLVMDLGKGQFSLLTMIKPANSSLFTTYDAIWEQTVFETEYSHPEFYKNATFDYSDELGHHCKYWHVPEITDSIKMSQYCDAEAFLIIYNKKMKPIK